VVEFLNASGGELREACVNGDTPLHQASQNGHLDVVKYLVENRVDVNVVNEDGWTPLYLAAKKGNVEVVKFLVEVNAVKVGKADPLQAAKCSGNEILIKFLSKYQ
jgi:ankyrin repeat protein